VIISLGNLSGVFGLHPVTNRSGFGGNLNMDPDPGSNWRNFTTALLVMENVPHWRFGSIPKICRLVDQRPNKLKAALVEACILRVIYSGV